ncbi:hypothetical protein [Microcoleus vaginatus]
MRRGFQSPADLRVRAIDLQRTIGARVQSGSIGESHDPTVPTGIEIPVS